MLNKTIISLVLAVSLGSLKFMYNYGYEVGSAHSTSVINDYVTKINDLEVQLKESQEKVKTEIVTKYVKSVKTIVKEEKVYVDQAKNDVPDKYVLSNGWVYLHNIATQGGDSDASRSADDSSSGVEANSALETITENYGICRENAEELKELQDFYRKAGSKIK